MDDQTPAAHQSTGFDPDVAIDDDFAAAHAMSDKVETIARPLDPDLLGVSGPHPKYIADRETMPRRVDRRLLDFRDRPAGQQVRQQRRQIEALVGPMPEGQHERSHDNKSFK
jgi:hypothetical protein